MNRNSRYSSLIVLTCLVLAASSTFAAGDNGVQLTPDAERIMVQSDIGSKNERWAITLNFDDGSLLGNVFRPGEPAAFVWCAVIDASEAEDPHNTLFTLSCFGADACPTTPCRPDEQWHALGQVQLRGAFFLP